MAAKLTPLLAGLEPCPTPLTGQALHRRKLLSHLEMSSGDDVFHYDWPTPLPSTADKAGSPLGGLAVSCHGQQAETKRCTLPFGIAHKVDGDEDM